MESHYKTGTQHMRKKNPQNASVRQNSSSRMFQGQNLSFYSLLKVNIHVCLMMFDEF